MDFIAGGLLEQFSYNSNPATCYTIGQKLICIKWPKRLELNNNYQICKQKKENTNITDQTTWN